jgi:hypothetical protein
MDTAQVVADFNNSPLFQPYVNGDDNGKESDNGSSYELRGLTSTPHGHWSSTSTESAPIPAERKSRKKRAHAVNDQSGKVIARQNVLRKQAHPKRAADGEFFSEEDVRAEPIRENGVLHNGNSLSGDVTKSAEEAKPYVNYIVDELVDTEEAYVKDLSEVVEVRTFYLQVYGII